jgi:hypothetical protein
MNQVRSIVGSKKKKKKKGTTTIMLTDVQEIPGFEESALNSAREP